VTQSYAEQIAKKRQDQESWGAIARMFAQLLRLWIAPPAIILARRIHDLGWIRLSRVFFRCAWANIPPAWRDSLDDWDVWSVRTREYRDDRRYGFRCRMAVRLIHLAHSAFDLGGRCLCERILRIANRVSPEPFRTPAILPAPMWNRLIARGLIRFGLAIGALKRVEKETR
jgi:hypothetical protein